MSKQARYFYEFGPFRIDPIQRVLLKGGEMVSLPPKVFDILQVLVENHGEIVSKDELMKRVWPDSFVEEGNLPVNIFALRKVLGQSGDQNQFIKTVPKRGYLFAMPVTEVWDERARISAPSESTLPSEIPGFQPESGSHEANGENTKSERGSRSKHSYLIVTVLLIVLAASWVMNDSRRSMTSSPARSVTAFPCPESTPGSGLLSKQPAEMSRRSNSCARLPSSWVRSTTGPSSGLVPLTRSKPAKKSRSRQSKMLSIAEDKRRGTGFSPNPRLRTDGS